MTHGSAAPQPADRPPDRPAVQEADADPIADLFGPGGALARRLPGFAPRPQQAQMAHAVADALEAGRHLLVEAGTGTGKTFAYLIPALLAPGLTVISTGTRVLQDQIVDKDIQALKKALPELFPEPGRVAVLKGRANYLCLHRYGALSAGRSSGGSVRAPVSRRDLIHLAAWAGETETGDIAEVTDLPESHPVWREVTVGADQCLGGRCDQFDECFITRARRRAMAADLIVVNHHLLFADLGVKSGEFGEVIPHYDNVIFDEAHLVEETATQFFGSRVSHYQLRDLCTDVAKEAVVLDTSERDRLTGDAQRVLDRAGPFFAHLANGQGEGRRPLRVAALGAAFAEAAARLGDALSLMGKACARLEDQSDDMGQLGRRAEQIAADLETVVGEPQPETVYWCESRGGGAVGASPLHVGPLLNEHLYGRVRSAVFTSATLATAAGMGYVRERLGFAQPGQPETPSTAPETAPETAPALPEGASMSTNAPPLPQAEEAVLGSPFDYAHQALLYLPGHLPPPTAPAYADAVAGEVASLCALSGGRALLLFTSYRMMEQVHERCADDLPGTVLKQGEMSRARLLAALVEESPATLFATGSFWQGVDVPGEALRLVVIDRLPFVSPDDPINQARVQAMQKAGKNAFMDYQVPTAALALKQGVGRLIRTVDDRGVVAILDHRITKKPYGRYFLESLPPMGRTGEIGGVAEFFKSA